MRRWALYISAAISLLLLLFTLKGWQTSYAQSIENWNHQVVWNDSVTKQYVSTSQRGVFALFIFDTRGPDGRIVERQVLKFSYWQLVILTAILPAISVVHFRRRRSEWKRRPGFCRKCGYNLIGNVSGACPECATPVSPTAHSN